MSVQSARSDDVFTDSVRFEQLMNKRLEEKINLLMLKATQSVLDLYQMLDEEGLLMKRIQLQLMKVAKSKNKLESLWLSNYHLLSQNTEVIDKIVFLFKYIYDKEKIGNISLASLIEIGKRDLKSDKLRLFNIDQSVSNFSDPTLLLRFTESDFMIEDVNMATLRLLGYMRKDLIGTLLSQGVSLFNLMIKPQFKLMWKIFKRRAENLTKNNVMYYLKHKNGFIKVVTANQRFFKAFNDRYLVISVTIVPRMSNRTNLIVNREGREVSSRRNPGGRQRDIRSVP